MKKYLVRTNCEYSIEVAAEDEDEAMASAAKVPYEQWGQAWAPYETETEDDSAQVAHDAFQEQWRRYTAPKTTETENPTKARRSRKRTP